MLEHLHSSHPGTQAMIARAVQTVYWPGFRDDIAKTRTNCETCSRYAPSNSPVLPISDPDIPQFPFQILCVDFMEWAGHHYLVLVDKYSNWLSVLKLAKDDSRHLIQALREYFAIFGVAEVFCTDGAAVFTSSEVATILQCVGN